MSEQLSQFLEAEGTDREQLLELAESQSLLLASRSQRLPLVTDPEDSESERLPLLAAAAAAATQHRRRDVTNMANSQLTPTLVLAICGAILGMFYFGYNTGVVSAPAPDIKLFINESHQAHYGVELSDSNIRAIYTAIVSMFVVGGMVGAMGGGYVADRLGRREGLIASQVMGVLGGIVSAISKPTAAWEVLLVGRLIVGVTAGLNTVLVPIYLSEIAPVQMRGGVGVLNQLAVTLGIFIGQILGLSEILGNGAGWAWLLAVTAAPAALQLILLIFFCPSSPRHLFISQGKEAEAKKELLRLRASVDEVDREMKEMATEKLAEKEPEMNVWDVLCSSKLRIPVIICIVMHLSQQLAGINGIFYYAVTFFTEAGIEETKAKYANLGVGAIMVAMTLVTVPLMDRLGRRFLHLLGLGGMFIMTILIIIAQNLSQHTGASIFLICVTLGFVVFFAVGPGSIPWMITGEMFTQGPRPAATAVCVLVNWSANLLVSLTFELVLVENLQEFTFLPFTILLGLFFIFVFLYLPETKGQTVGETAEQVQQRGWKISGFRG